MDSEMVGRSERNELARQYIDSAEAWLRKIIDYRLSAVSGPSYISGGNWKRNLTEHVSGKKALYPGKFPREIDTTTFEQAINILCHPNVWNSNFKEVFSTAYPLGSSEARQFLESLKDIRNDVSHGRSCSARQLEKAICYANDFIDDVKSFFNGESMQRVYNVPMIVRYSDSLGNDSNLENVPTDLSLRLIDWRTRGAGDLYPGLILTAEIEIDPNFPESGYTVASNFGHTKFGEGNKLEILVENRHVSEQIEIIFSVKSNKDWHRQFGLDDQVMAVYRVLPPVDG